MAGNWIKFETSLPEKPETLAITTAMGWEDPDLTVGKLMRLFRWFDEHTVNGNARGVTATSLDRIIGVAGFAQAVADSGWLLIDQSGVTLGKFDRHNGATAKSRAQTAKRVANHRGKEAGNEGDTPQPAGRNASTVTGALAREEKNREEKQPPLGFARFWSAWPKSDRKGAKGECLKAWMKAGAEASADAVVAHVEHMATTLLWTKDGGQFVPAPLVYLNQRRWEGAEDDGEQSGQRGFV